MSDACCGHDEPAGSGAASDDGEREPERLWEVSELRFAAVAGVVLLAGYVIGWIGGPAPSKSVCMRLLWRSGPTRSFLLRCAGWPAARSVWAP
ncbi:cadmium-exporting ATPase domain protein [Mycobacteroides abscessus 21]|uniref:Cadmium-exporting ATPase domain protein n=1 Tax=Mycobacteroides abscessus 21 TaxID=1299324 RepID=A0A829Q8K9_9MYCO|nr:cadmium-exporting ATPase domain protein [Mycobacteroides abscessus 21]